MKLENRPSSDSSKPSSKTQNRLVSGKSYNTTGSAVNLNSKSVSLDLSQAILETDKSQIGKTDKVMFGRVLEKNGNEAGSWKYLIECMGQRVAAVSSEDLMKGDFLHFILNKSKGNLFLNQIETKAGLSETFSGFLKQSGLEYSPAYRLAFDFLSPFQQEDFFSKAVGDFGNLISESGILSPSENYQGAGLSSGEQQPAFQESRDKLLTDLDYAAIIRSLPENNSRELSSEPGGNFKPSMIHRFFLNDQMDSLLNLFLKYPRDQRLFSTQAAIWGTVIRDPFWGAGILDNLSPHRAGSGINNSENQAALLGTDSMLFRSAHGSFAGIPNLPEVFNLETLIKTMMDLDDKGKLNMEQKLQKFVFQAIEAEVSREKDPWSGENYFGYYRGEKRWKGIRFKFQLDRKGMSQKENKKLKLKIETDTLQMGRVILDAVLDKTGAELMFQNENGNVKDILEMEIFELEKQLRYMDFKINKWSYASLKKKPVQVERTFSFKSGINKTGEDGSIDVRA